MYTIKDVLDILGVGEVKDMLNTELRNSTLVSKVFTGIDDDRLEDEPAFVDWLKEKGRGFIWAFLSLPILVTLYVIGKHLKFENLSLSFQYLSENGSKTLKGNLGILILIVITFVITYMALRRPKNTLPNTNKLVNRAIKSGETIMDYWLFVWITWFLLYLTYTFEWLQSSNQLPLNIPTAWFYSFQNLFNNSTAVFFFCMYFEMSHETRNESTHNFKKLPVPFLLISGLIFLFELIVLSISKDKIEDHHFYFALFSGLCNGVVMGLFISRLESIIFNTPLYLVSFFILYAVVQPTIYFLNDEKYAGLSFALILIAFFGKIFMFITLSWLQDTNRLTYYLVRWLYIYQQEINLRLRGLFFKTLKDEENRSIPVSEEN